MRFLLPLLFLVKSLFSLQPSLLEKDLPSPALLELLEVCGIEHDGSLEDVMKRTQKAWYQGGKERWELEKLKGLKEEEVFPLLDRLHVLETIHAPLETYDYVLVHGSLLNRVEKRILFLASEWKRGVRFNKIVFLTGDRPLLPEEMVRLKGETNEVEMIQFVYKHAALPEEMRKLPVEWISAPKVEKNGKLVRPGTKETILEWIKRNPAPGKCLAISNQPYVGYQDAIARTYLPAEFSLLTIGNEADQSTTVEIHLDNLARWLYAISNSQ